MGGIVKETRAFEVFAACANAIMQGVLINRVSRTDKEFHFQNWFELYFPVTGDVMRRVVCHRAQALLFSVCDARVRL